jgi:hypothetical protein
MLAHVAQRALAELNFARSTLTGEVPLKNLPPVPQAKDEQHLRQVVAIAVIERLGSLLAEIASITEEADHIVYDLAENLDLRQPPEQEEKRLFGFAAFRQAA